MEIEGRVIAVCPEQGGVSQRTGTQWKSQEYVIETHDQYPRKCCFRVFGAEKIAAMNIQVGEELRVSFDVDAREYQGRWYNGVRAFRVDRNVQTAAATAAPLAPDTTPFGGAPVPTQAPAAPAGETTPFAPAADGEDLPF